MLSIPRKMSCYSFYTKNHWTLSRTTDLLVLLSDIQILACISFYEDLEHEEIS